MEALTCVLVSPGCPTRWHPGRGPFRTAVMAARTEQR